MIELRGITRNFRVGEETVHALRDIDLDVGAGEYVSIMGTSGSGKSTLLNVIGLLDRASSGSYRIEGRDVTTLDDEEQARVRREKIGFVFQFFQLVPRLDAAQNVALPLVLAGMSSQERAERVGEHLKRFGLADRAHHRPDQLSGGQRQRVAIARATISRPRIVLADEPTGNLDRATGEEVVRVLESLHEEGITLLVVTHDPALGKRARRRLRLDDGRIVGDEGDGR